jgi:hypothetical protein
MQIGWTRRQKPPIGTQIDHTHTLANGLVWLAPLWESGGTSVADPVGGVNLAFTGSAPWVPGSSPATGAGLRFNTTNNYASALLPSRLQIQAPATLIVGATQLGGANGGQCPYLSLSTISTSVPQYGAVFGLCANGTFGPQLLSGVGAGTHFNNVTVNSSAIPANNVPYVLVAVFGVSSWTFYAFPQSGSSLPLITGPTAWTYPLTGVTYLSTATLGFGGSPDWGSYVNANIYFGAIYNRALTAGEAAAWGRNPWQIFKPSAGVAELTGSVFYYTLAGPTTDTVGAPSSNFTLTPSAAVTDNYSLASSAAGDTFSSSVPTFISSAASEAFTVTPAAHGLRTITVTSSAGHLVSGSPWTLMATVPLSLSGPSLLYEGVPATLTITPNTTTNDTITLSDGSKGGTFTPPTLSWVSSGAARTVTYTAATAGSIAISAVSSSGATVTGSPLSLYSYAAVVDAYVTKYGKLIVFGTNSVSLVANGNAVPAVVTAVNATPTVAVNGKAVHLGPATWLSATLDSPFVTFLLQCGSVQSLAFTNAGTTSYTAPTVTWNGDGGGSGLTLGTPVTASGILGYTITSSGSGYTTSFAIAVPGGTYTQQAYAWVTVSGGAVTSVAPLTGSAAAYGIGYSGTLTGVSLSGGSAIQYNYNSGWTTVSLPGSGLTVSCTIGNYIQSVPVTNGGNGFTSPPTFTISDSGSGAGAAVVPVMSGPLPTDVITYSATSGWLTTKVQSTTSLLVPASTNAPVTNWVGQLEGPTGRMLGFTAKPSTLLAGGGVCAETPYEYNFCFMGKNKLKAASPWNAGYSCTSVTLDSDYYPTFWTPLGSIYSTFYCTQESPGYVGPTAQYQGNWTLQYDDDYYAGNAATPAYVTIYGGANISVVPGPYATLPVVGTVTVSGGQITAIAVSHGGTGIQGAVVTITGTGSNAIYVAPVSNGVVTGLTKISGGSGYTGTPTVTITPVAVSGSAVTVTYNIALASQNVGSYMNLTMSMWSGADGVCHVHNPWVFAPNNTISRANPYALDDNVVAMLTNNGFGPASMRYMPSMGGAADANVIDPADIMNPNVWAWQAPDSQNGRVAPGAPYSPTFSGTTTAGSAIITGIANTSSLSVGQSIVGSGIPGMGFNPSIVPVTTITAINSSTSITMSANAMISGVQSLSVNPTSSGQIVFNYVRFYNTNPASATYTWSSPHLYTSENWAISGTDSFGPYLTMTGGPHGANDNGAFLVSNNQYYGVMELVSNIPHGLKTGQTLGAIGTQSFHGNTTSASTTISGITGTATLLAGQIITGAGIPSGTSIVTVNSSTTITLSQPATATATAVGLTAWTAVPWSVSGIMAVSNLTVFGSLWVTGPNSIVVSSTVAAGSGTSFQTVNSTTQIPIYLPVTHLGCQMLAPVEYAASAVSNWPNTALHLNVPWVCSDACLAAFAQKVAAHIGPTNPIYIEMGNEHWNSGEDTEPIWEGVQAGLMQYFPTGTAIYPHYNSTRQVVNYTTTGSALPNNDYIYALRAANKHYAFCKGFAAAGGNSSRVKLVYGSWWTGPTTSTNIAAAATAYALPQDYVAVAPYLDMPSDAPLLAANYPAGFAGSANNGNWPIDAINDFCRHYVFYSQNYQKLWTAHATAISGTTLQIYGYEGAIDEVAVNVPFSDYVNQDSFNHPSFYEVIWCYFLWLQNGNYNMASSGMRVMNYFQLIQNSVKGYNWKLSTSAAQPIGHGLSNQYMSPQGGLPGTGNPNGYFQTNQAIGLQALHDWIGYTPTPKPTPSPAKSMRRWFSGLSTRPARIAF